MELGKGKLCCCHVPLIYYILLYYIGVLLCFVYFYLYNKYISVKIALTLFNISELKAPQVSLSAESWRIQAAYRLAENR